MLMNKRTIKLFHCRHFIDSLKQTEVAEGSLMFKSSTQHNTGLIIKALERVGVFQIYFQELHTVHANFMEGCTHAKSNEHHPNVKVRCSVH